MWCETCGDPAQPDDWIAGLAALICPLCLERLLDADMPEPQP